MTNEIPPIHPNVGDVLKRPDGFGKYSYHMVVSVKQTGSIGGWPVYRIGVAHGHGIYAYDSAREWSNPYIWDEYERAE